MLTEVGYSLLREGGQRGHTITCARLTQSTCSRCGLPALCRGTESVLEGLSCPHQSLNPRGEWGQKRGLVRPSPRFFALFSMLYETLSPDTMRPETPRLWAMKLCSLRSFVPGGSESQPSVLLEQL